MISKKAQFYCKEDLSLIENYDKAISDNNVWEIHHRLETELNLSRKDLQDRNLYFNRPASELIFLTHSEHRKIHVNGENNCMYGRYGVKNPFYNLHHSENTKKMQSDYNLGSRVMSNGIECHYVHRDKIDYYLSLGYHFGRK